MTDELIRDQLIVQCKDKKIQARLWAAKNLSLKEATDMAKVIEQSQTCMIELNRKDTLSTVMIESTKSMDVVEKGCKNKSTYEHHT